MDKVRVFCKLFISIRLLFETNFIPAFANPATVVKLLDFYSFSLLTNVLHTLYPEFQHILWLFLEAIFAWNQESQMIDVAWIADEMKPVNGVIFIKTIAYFLRITKSKIIIGQIQMDNILILLDKLA